jgi:branched-subunit amino acid aminotransferase/4-amino-4-deoxychorismate lyase
MKASNSISILTTEQILSNLKTRSHPSWNHYHAYFSTWLGGIVTDPALMMLPMDDHMVHRGDGVFEALKAVGRRVFLMKEHLARLELSAARIGIALPFQVTEIEDIIFQTLKVADRSDVLVRLFISRGPGGYTTNPYDSVGSQMYLTVTSLPAPRLELYETGVRIGRSEIPVKESWMAQVKSCNYLPNVMMKKEALDRQLDFTIGFDSENHIAESSTENIAFVDSQGILTMPHFKNILKGTTMVRVFELAREAGLPTGQRVFTEAELLNSREVLMIGTTLDVLPVTSYENQKINGGKVGPVAQKLRALLTQDLKVGPKF